MELAMKAGQAAKVLEELATVLELAGGKKGSSEISALAEFFKEAPDQEISEAIPLADADAATSAYFQALCAAGQNRQLFEAVLNVLKNDKLVSAERMSSLAARYTGMPKVKGRPKALQAIKDKFETGVQRERKLREIDRLNQD